MLLITQVFGFFFSFFPFNIPKRGNKSCLFVLGLYNIWLRRDLACRWGAQDLVGVNNNYRAEVFASKAFIRLRLLSRSFFAATDNFHSVGRCFLCMSSRFGPLLDFWGFFPPALEPSSLFPRFRVFMLGRAALFYGSSAAPLLRCRRGFRPCSCVLDAPRGFSVLWWLWALVIFTEFPWWHHGNLCPPVSSSVTFSSGPSASQLLIFKTCCIELLTLGK